MQTGYRATYPKAITYWKEDKDLLKKIQDSIRPGVRPGHTKVKNKEKIFWDLASDTPILPKSEKQRKNCFVIQSDLPGP